MRALRDLVILSSVALGIVAGPRSATGQTVMLMVDQSYSSLEQLSSPTGVALAVADLGGIGPVSFEAGYRYRPQASQGPGYYCPFFFDPSQCISGEMRETARLHTVHVGAMATARLPPYLQLGAGITAGVSGLRIGSTLVATGEKLENTRSSAVGFGAVVQIRAFSPKPGIGAVARLQIEKLNGQCVLDVSSPFCDGRTVRSLQVGLTWTPR